MRQLFNFVSLPVCFCVVVAATASGGEFNTVLEIGDAAPGWEKLPGVDGKQHSLADLAKKRAVVVVFTCNSCPYAVDAEDRLIELSKKYQDQGVAVVAINVNLIDEDRLPAMRERASEQDFPFAYLFDESQQIGRAFGAKFTPECFVLDQDRKIAYMGSLDDSPDGRNVSQRYVEAAVDAALDQQQPQLTETVPIGCLIRYQRSRR